MNKITLIAILLSSVASNQAFAGPADYIFTPIVEYGEKEVEFKYGSGELQNGTSNQVGVIGFGAGIKEHWFTEMSLKNKRKGGKETNLLEWENKFQLTETGEYPVDIGAITELEAPLSSNTPWEVKVGGLLQTEIGKMQLNGNLIFKREFALAGSSFNTLMLYQLQAKYRLQPAFEFGVQSFGDMGRWNDWSRQSKRDHFVGPAVFGKINMGDRRFIKYNAAWLFGASSAAPKHTLRTQIEYEFF
ncbi:MAG: hypothetical protein ABL902_06025 [Gallionella sp.]|nr:hypothetical protein [Gallionella sp.]